MTKANGWTTQLISRGLGRTALAAAVTASLMMSSAVYALGVGQVQVRSALNQRLNAEMELFSIKPDELENLTVKISTQVLSGNINSQPSNFDYTIETRGGRYFLRLTSKQSMREPLLNFLIELEWPQGRLLRELAIFLDPPASSVDPSLTASLPPPQAPVPATPTKRTRPSASNSRSAASRQDASPTRSADTSAAAEIVGNYGPVVRGETLWGIADRLRPAGVSVQQMMQTLYQNNPRAFSKPGLDYLMAGVTLQVPTVAGAMPKVAAAEPKPAPQSSPKAAENQVEIRLVPPTGQEADAQTASQPGSASSEQGGGPTRLRIASLRDLQTRIQNAQSDNPEVLVGKSDASTEQTAELATAAPVNQDSAAAETVPATEASSQVNTTDNEASTESAAAPAEVRLDTAALKSETATGDESQSDTSAPAPVTIATAPVQPLQSEQIGAQPQTAEAKDGANSSNPSATAESVDTSTTTTAVEPGTETSNSEISSTEVNVDTATPAIESATDEEPLATATTTPQSAVATVELANEQPKAAGIDVVGMLIKFQRDPVAMLREIQQHPLGLPIAGGVLIVLLLLIATVARRSRKAEDYSDIDRSLALSSAAMEKTGSASKAMRRSAVVEPAEIASKLRLQRVDFLIAGGSYEEAEKVLRRSLSENPFDLRVKEKMLDMYYKSGNTDQYMTVAESVRSQIDSEQSPLWQKVIKQGNKVYPGHPLFESVDDAGDTIVFTPPGQTPRANEQPDKPRMAPAAATGAMVLDFGQARATTEKSESLSQPEAADSKDTAATNASKTEDDIAAFELGNLDEWRDNELVTGANTLKFDGMLDDTDQDLEKELAKMPSAQAASNLDFAAGPQTSDSGPDNDDMILHLDTEPDPLSGVESSAADFDLDTLSIEESELHFAGQDTAASSSFEEQVDPLSDDHIALEFGDALEYGDAVDDEDTQLISAALDGETTQTMDAGDYVEIKLDLANAYLEMDDRAGAMSLLQEVAAEGNDSQKSRATELLECLDQ